MNQRQSGKLTVAIVAALTTMMLIAIAAYRPR
jgi:hypothetical protein